MTKQAIGVAYVHVEPEAKGFGKTIEGDVDKAIENASKKGSSSLISKIGGAFGKVGKIGATTITGLTTGIAALAAKGGFDRALNIENAQAKLTGLGHDSASVTEIMNDALASVKGTAFGLGDAATVAASLSASGVAEGEQLTSVLKTVADTAQISGRSITDIGTIFGSVAARGKLQGDDMLQLMSSGIPVLQMLATHLGKTSAEVSDMVSAGQVDFQTFADAMQEGLGGAAQSAGTTFTGALSNVKAALSRLGETAATPFLNGLRGLFNQAIPVIDQFTASATPVLEAVGATVQTAMEQAIPAVQNLFRQLGQNQTVQQLADSFGGLVDKIGEFAGSLAGAASSVWGELSGQLSAVSGQLPGLVDLFSSLLDALSGAFDFIGAHAGTLVPLAEGLGAVVLAGNGVNAVTGGLKALASTASGVTKTATAAFDLISKLSAAGSVAGGLKTLASSFDVVKAAQSAWTAITKAATAVQLAFNLAMDANPILLIVTAIGAVVAALALFFAQTETGRNAWSQFVSWFMTVWDTIGTVCQPVLTAIGAFITQTMTQIQQVWQTAWTLITTVAQNVWNTIGPVVMAALQQIQTIFQTVVDVIGPIWNGFWSILGTVVQSAWSIVTTLVSTALSVIQGIIKTVLDVVNGDWDAVWNDIQAVASTVWNAICSIVSTCVNAVRSVIGTVCSTISNIWNALWNGAKNIVSSVWGGITGTVGNAVNSLINSVQGIGGKVKSALSDAGSWLLNAGEQVIAGLWNGISGAIGGLYDNIKNAMSGLVDKAKDALGIHSPSRVFRTQVGIQVGKGMALGIDDSATVVNKAMDSLVSSMSLDDTDWSKTGRLNITTTANPQNNENWQTAINKLDTLIQIINEALADDRPFTQRDFARLVRSLG